jgi:hypothetical protein
MSDTYYADPQDSALLDNLVYKRRYQMGESSLLPPQVGPPGVSLHQACLVSYRHDTKLLVGTNF